VLEYDLDPTPGTIIDLEPELSVIIGPLLTRGDVADIFSCHFEGYLAHTRNYIERGQPRTQWERLRDIDSLLPREMGEAPKGAPDILKMARVAGDNDLLVAEHKSITRLLEKDAGNFHQYLPQSLVAEPIYLRGRAANVLPKISGHIAIADIIKAFPNGIDFRDMAWMFKRSLVLLCYAHHQLIIHGAVFPPHILVHPTGHGAKLIDWCYSVGLGSKTSIKAYPSDWVTYVAPEVLEKHFPTAATDIYSLAMTIIRLVGGDVKTLEFPDSVPTEIQELLQRCTQAKPSERPQNAWVLHDEFDKILRQLVGEPAYRRFVMPNAHLNSRT